MRELLGNARQPLLFLFLCISAGSGSSWLSNELRLGADYTNQTYSTWVSDTAATDTNSVETEARIAWRLNLTPARGNSYLNGTNTLTLSTASVRNNLALTFKQSLTSSLMLETQLDAEARQYHRLFPAISDTTWRRDQLQAAGQLGFRWQPLSQTDIIISDRLELQHYPRPDSYNYDYLLNRLAAGCLLHFNPLSSFDAAAQWSERTAWAVDSQNYSDYSLRLGFDSYLGEEWQLRLANDLSRRRYLNPARCYWEECPNVELSWNVSSWLTLQAGTDASLTLYDAPTQVYVNTWSNRPRISLVWHISQELSLRPGTRLETSRSLPAQRPEDYRDRSLELGADLLIVDRLWISAEDRLGMRTYQSADSSYQTDYRYNELTAMLDWTLHSRVNLTGMVTVAPEWHAEETDNLAATTLSVELRYGF